MVPSLAFVGGLVVDSRRSKFQVADPTLGLKILTSKYDLSNRPPPKPLAAMSSLALLSRLAVLL